MEDVFGRCHFVDLCNYLIGSEYESLTAKSLSSSSLNFIDEDNFSTLIKYKDGSLANISYYSNGPLGLDKENIEIFCEDVAIQINDFKDAKYINKYKTQKFKEFGQNKGQKNMIKAYVDNLMKNNKSLINIVDLITTSKITFEIVDKIRGNNNEA